VQTSQGKAPQAEQDLAMRRTRGLQPGSIPEVPGELPAMQPLWLAEVELVSVGPVRELAGNKQDPIAPL
jgi:hypothetical protein